MTNSEMFKAAHAGAKADRAFDAYYSYAYYFRLHLLVLQRQIRDAKASLVIGFQVVEPKRLYA
jgi:hypothetical protein